MKRAYRFEVGLIVAILMIGCGSQDSGGPERSDASQSGHVGAGGSGSGGGAGGSGCGIAVGSGSGVASLDGGPGAGDDGSGGSGGSSGVGPGSGSGADSGSGAIDAGTPMGLCPTPTGAAVTLTQSGGTSVLSN